MFKVIKEKIERVDLYWFGRYKIRVVIFVGLNLLFLILSRLPYFNLVLSGQIMLLVPITLAIIIFNLSPELIIKFTAPIFILTFIVAIIFGSSVSEILGNYAYIFLFIAVFKMAINLFSNND